MARVPKWVTITAALAVIAALAVSIGSGLD
jgi:hypothetical protein